MAESNIIDTIIKSFEDSIITSGKEDINQTIEIVQVVRDTFASLGMNKRDADMFVANAEISVNVELSDAQMERLKKVARDMTTLLYDQYKGMSFEDEAIAAFGKNFSLVLDEE